MSRSAALQVAREQGALTLVDLNEAGLEGTVSAIRELAPDTDIHTVTANVANEAEVEEYAARTVERFGRIDGFFNNAGLEGKQNLTEDFGSDEFAEIARRVNLLLNLTPGPAASRTVPGETCSPSSGSSTRCPGPAL